MTRPTASTSPPSAPAAEETVEAYRRYPAPEMVEVQPRNATAAEATVAAAPPASDSSASGTQDGATSHATPPPSALPRLSLRLRWGVEAGELRRLYEMHEDVFPISYSPTFYEWLLNHDACVGLLALATPEDYAAYETHWNRTRALQSEARAPPPRADASAAAAPGHPPVPPPASQAPLTPDLLMKRADMDRVISELEDVAARQVRPRPPTQRAATASSDASDGAAAAAAATHTVVVGFIIGQFAYARHEAGHLCTNPTAYIGSFAVDPALQGCGVGDLLLQRFVHYMTELRPAYAHDYLHYNERKLIAMLVEAQLKKRRTATEVDDAATAADVRVHKKTDGDVAAPTHPRGAASAAAAVSRLSQLQRLVVAAVPELQGWLEDRHARRALRRRGLTEDEIDAQRFRDRLAPDALTDEEAEEVRREARRFTVQTGVPEVWLHCLPGNTQATSFYAKRGFTVHRTLTDYYTIDDTRYDAYLLRYLTPAQAAAAAAVSAAEQRTLAEEGDAAEATAASSPSPGATPEPALAAGGLRRRREEAAATAAALTSAPTDAGDALAAAASPVKGLAATPASARRHTSSTWLHAATYGNVADVVLSTPEEGQQEWRDRTEAGGARVEGRLTWWEYVREWGFIVNALGLLCAVLWLAYNVWLTGKVE